MFSSVNVKTQLGFVNSQSKIVINPGIHDVQHLNLVGITFPKKTKQKQSLCERKQKNKSLSDFWGRLKKSKSHRGTSEKLITGKPINKYPMTVPIFSLERDRQIDSLFKLSFVLQIYSLRSISLVLLVRNLVSGSQAFSLIIPSTPC